jgi:hypothetical protein
VIVPGYWAEARVVGTVGGKKRVVRRFGWSDVGAAEAQRHAEQRADDAIAELVAGRDVPRRERKLPYGTQGLPIREQIVARYGDAVVTRNAYGARCLNEPDVLFADIDFEPRLPAFLERLFSGLLLKVALGSLASAVLLFLGAKRGQGCWYLIAAVALPITLLILRDALRRRPENVAMLRQRALDRVRGHASSHPEVRFALYESPAGLRVLALHGPFDPRGEEARRLFAELGTDPAYAQMCALQACFRARVSPKPWRIGIRDHMKPRPGVWPVREERRAEREKWIARYEAQARGFSACQFLEELGEGRVDPRCAAMQRLHDDLSRARARLPMA